MTARDEEIVAALCSKARFFCLKQVARDWWGEQSGDEKAARRRLLFLAGAGWLKKSTVLVRPLLQLERPVIEWKPYAPAADFSAVSRVLQARWKEPASKTELFLASRHARAVFGGNAIGSIKNLCQTTHDLHVAEVFLFYRRTCPEAAHSWVSEDEVAQKRKGKKLPDAFLKDDAGKIARVIEFGGAYSASRLSELHTHCAENDLPYEIW